MTIKKMLIGAMCCVAACVMAKDAKVSKCASAKGLFPDNVKTVGIVMPSSVLDRKKLDFGVRLLKEAGYKVKLGDFVLVKERAAVEDRVKDFEKMWLDPEVDIIFMARGGEGAIDVIDKIDWAKLREREMRVIGFSDITLILNTMLSQKAGHPYSGPMLSAFGHWDKDSRKWFRASLDGGPLKPVKVRVLKAGSAKGLPMGGHLERLHRLFTTTKLAPSTDGRIVFIECTARYPASSVTGWLEELRDKGYLKNVAAVVFADFRHTGDERKVIDDFLSKFAQTLPCPVFADYPYGHCTKSYLIDFFRELEISPDGTVTPADKK
ncbi:MAG: LD-carboxypeptidase [Kiritimatiellae bacterium]|nr:LD-carboxypeptidase [Kiritimatiellia bacterium]